MRSGTNYNKGSSTRAMESDVRLVFPGRNVGLIHPCDGERQSHTEATSRSEVYPCVQGRVLVA